VNDYLNAFKQRCGDKKFVAEVCFSCSWCRRLRSL